MWDHEEGHEEVLWQFAQARKRHSVFSKQQNTGGVQPLIGSMPDTQTLKELDLPTFEDMWCNDNR